MTTKVLNLIKPLNPQYSEGKEWRNIVKRNSPSIKAINFIIESDETWLPTILRDAGFFPSNAEIKRNLKHLWRDREEIECLKIKYAFIKIFPLGTFDDRNVLEVFVEEFHSPKFHIDFPP